MDYPPRISGSDAIASIREAARAGIRILGLDGFTIVPEGFRADLDLLLDVSKGSISDEEAAAAAVDFVNAKDRPDVVWEVWVDD